MMSQQLIPLHQSTIGTATVQTANAREIHTYLEVKTRFDDWIKRRISTYGFSQGIDFTVLTFEDGSVRTIEYFVTLDMAKQLAMVERTAKGREAREYFIACEKALTAQPESEGSILVRLAIAYERQEAIQRQLTQDMLALQAQTIANQAKTIEAHELATRALEAQLWMTLRQYRYVNQLQHQLSDIDLKDFANYLTGYCLQQGIPIAAEPVADKIWGKENKYHVATIAGLLPIWLQRRYAQHDLSTLPN